MTDTAAVIKAEDRVIGYKRGFRNAVAEFLLIPLEYKYARRSAWADVRHNYRNYSRAKRQAWQLRTSK